MSFFLQEINGLKCQNRRSVKIMPVCTPLSMPIKTKPVKCTRYESVEKFTLMNLLETKVEKVCISWDQL